MKHFILPRLLIRLTALAAFSLFLFPPILAQAADATAPDPNPNTDHAINLSNEIGGVPAKRTITIPNVGEFRVLKGDFHIHTLFSDGRVWPTERVIEADANGLDAIAITDHIEYRPNLGGSGRASIRLRDENDNHNLSHDLAQTEADKRGLLLVRGTEITKSHMPPGHFNALFIKDANKIAALADDYRKMFKETVAQGGFLLWNHPGWQSPKSGGLEPGAPITFTPTHEEILKNGWMHGIEAFNNKEFYPIVANWCAQKNLAILADSDIHATELETYGPRNPRRPITLVLAREKTLESLREAFFAKRTIGWAADMIFGQEKWLRPLFEACIEIKKEGATLLLTNRSSIPARITVGAQTLRLPPLGTATAPAAQVKTLTVENWLIAQNTPLTVPVD